MVQMQLGSAARSATGARPARLFGAGRDAQLGAKRRMSEHDLPDDPRFVVMQFESLGGTGHGCEFGIFQRAFGAEPLGLLRWADLGHESLTSALRDRFGGVGEQANTEIFVPESDGRREWWSRDRRYWMAMRTFIDADEVLREQAETQILRRLCYLRDKLISDLEAGDKIFVYKNMMRNLTDSELAALYLAVRSYGDNTMLYLRYADEAFPVGSVAQIAPGLLAAAVERFSFSPDNENLGLPPHDAFLAICRRALECRANTAYARDGGADHPRGEEFSGGAAMRAQLANAIRGVDLRRQASERVAARDYAGAEVKYREVLAISPDAATLIEYGDVLAQQRRFQEAVATIDAAIELLPDTMPALARRAGWLLHDRKPAEAEATARLALAREPDSLAMQDILCFALQAQQKIQDLVPAARRAVALGPHDAHRQLRLARALLQQGSFNEAADTARAAQSLDRTLVSAYDTLTDALEKSDRWPEAADAMRTALEIAPGDVGRQVRLGQILLRAGRLAEAEQVLRDTGTPTAPGHAFHKHHLLGMVLQRQGRLEDACAEARRAVVLSPDNAHLHGRLASLLLLTGGIAEAAQVCQAAAARWPDDGLIKEVMNSLPPAPVEAVVKPAASGNQGGRLANRLRRQARRSAPRESSLFR